MAKYYYNGVLLPEIPADKFVAYQKQIILKWPNGNIQLIGSKNGLYFNGSTAVYDKNSATLLAYYLSDDTWVEDTTQSGKYTGWTIMSNQASTLHWSNHDISNGSATATTIYFFGTEAVSGDSPNRRMEYLQATGTQYFNTGIVPDATTEVEIKYSVQSILRYGSHMLSCAGWYTPFPRTYTGAPSFLSNRLGTEVTINLTPTVNTEYTVKAFPDDKAIINEIEYSTVLCGSSSPSSPLYMFTYGGDPGSANYTATSRVYYCKIWQGDVLVRNFTPLWKAGVVGMYDEVNKVFYTSEGGAEFFAGPMLEPTYDRKYLLRSNTVLYTVTDGTLNALTETEITTSLFQTYGMDALPDGALLATLTDPEVLYWQDSDDDLPVLTAAVTGVPPTPQVVVTDAQDMSDSTILGIESVTVTASEDVLFAISFDDGATWKAYNGNQWATVDTENAGMTKTTMENISLEAWAEVVSGTVYRLRFALMSTESYVTAVVINYLN